MPVIHVSSYRSRNNSRVKILRLYVGDKHWCDLHLADVLKPQLFRFPQHLNIHPNKSGKQVAPPAEWSEWASETPVYQTELSFEIVEVYPGGLSIEEMTDAAKAIDNPTDEKADILFKVEKTDMFEQMVSSDEGKAERIKAIITRYIQNLPSENAYEDSNNSNIENVDVMGFLRITKK